MKGWWHHASTEQKLAQIDAGIELGLTARQVALASGCNWLNLSRVAHYHGRKFAATGYKVQSNVRTAAKKSRQAAYFRGENVDLWRDGAQDRAARNDDDRVEELILE